MNKDLISGVIVDFVPLKKDDIQCPTGTILPLHGYEHAVQHDKIIDFPIHNFIAFHRDKVKGLKKIVLNISAADEEYFTHPNVVPPTSLFCPSCKEKEDTI